MRNRLNFRGRDTGVAAVTVGITLLVLVGMAALAVDGSNLYRERGDAQNAADLTAYAAAFEECTGGDETSAAAAGLAQALANGYDDSDATVVQAGPHNVIVEKVSDGWSVRIETSVDGFFSAVLGAETLPTNAEAIAQCTTSVVSGYALFAGGQCGAETLDWSGSDNTVTGDVHSNGGIDMSGSTNTINGNTTTVGTVADGGGSNTFNPPQTEGVPWESWPIVFDASDFLPGVQ